MVFYMIWRKGEERGGGLGSVVFFGKFLGWALCVD